MGRPERPLDPESGPVQQLAHGLRELRRAVGSPSYQAMAKTAGCSATTLSRAAAGVRLPSLDVLRGYVRACGGDIEEWETRWKEAEAADTAPVPTATEDAPSPPYRGLARFEPADRHLFFGRDRVTEDLGALVRDHRLAVLFGASGSGKSSLLRAGLIPLLRERAGRHDGDGGRPPALRVLTPGARPAATYCHLLAPAEGEPESWVVVDQFEEVFTLCHDQAERARFIDLVLAARDPRSRLRVLIAVRADFYPRCLEHRGLADALRGAALALGPMTADELREAVVKPAATAGLLVERELTARLVDEILDEPGALPMLSHALLETWRRRRSRMLSLAAYEAAGGVRGAIAATAEEVYGTLDPEERAAARRLLLRMVEPGGEPAGPHGQGAGGTTADTRRPLSRAELDEWADPVVPGVVERLAGARLLTADEDGVQLTHEALISCWPRLAGWLEEDRERLRHHRRLAEAARAWLEADRDPGALWRGTRLDLAREGFTHDDLLTAAERDFLAAALEARDAEHRTAARAARRSRLLLTTLSAVVAVAVAVGLVAVTQARAGERQRTEAAARRAAAVADSLRTTDPRTAMRLSAAAWRLAALPESRRALLGALAQPELDTFTAPQPSGMSTDHLVDSGRSLLGVDDRTWRTWDVATHRRTASGTLPAGAQLFATGPDAHTLALVVDDGIRLWDTERDRWVGESRPRPRRTTYLAFGGSGRAYVVGDVRADGADGIDGRVELRSVADGRLLFATEVPGGAQVAPSPDDRYVALCPAGKAPRVFDTGDGHEITGAWQNADGLCGDGVRLLFGGARGAAQRFAAVDANGVSVWDTATRREVATLSDPEVTSAVFSADGAFLATANDTEIKVWRPASPDAPVFRRPLDEQQAYGTLAWNPAHTTLRYLDVNTVHSFDTTTATTSAWRDEALADTLLSPNGDTVATARLTGDGYRFELRGTAEDRGTGGGDDTRGGSGTRVLPSVPLPGPADPERPVVARETAPLMAFSPDGEMFAYGASALAQDPAEQRITVWDVARGRVLATLRTAPERPSADSVLSIALGPGGRTLYAVRQNAEGGAVNEVWNVTRGRRSGVVAKPAGSLLAVRPDGRLLAGENRAVRLPSGRPTDLGPDPDDGITALAFTADGTRLAAGDRSRRVTLWDGDLSDHTDILRDAFPDAPAGSPEEIGSVALSPDGGTLAVGGDEGTLQLWDLDTRQPLGGPLPTPGEAITSLAFAPDGQTLYASGTHVPVQRYDLDSAHALRRVCARAGGQDMTRTTWRTYLPDATYRKVCDDR
ncbi:nSTAND1 domain-containing NTPase [Streptomyces sp. NPDC002643]